MFYLWVSSPVQNNSNKHRASILPTSIFECYELQVEPHNKPEFQSLHIHTFHPSKRKRLRVISLSEDSFVDDPDNQESPEKLILIFPSFRL